MPILSMVTHLLDINDHKFQSFSDLVPVVNFAGLSCILFFPQLQGPHPIVSKVKRNTGLHNFHLEKNLHDAFKSRPTCT